MQYFTYYLFIWWNVRSVSILLRFYSSSTFYSNLNYTVCQVVIWVFYTVFGYFFEESYNVAERFLVVYTSFD